MKIIILSKHVVKSYISEKEPIGGPMLFLHNKSSVNRERFAELPIVLPTMAQNSRNCSSFDSKLTYQKIECYS